MATVILIVFLAIVAVLGGWWLRRERVNQKKELLDRGKIAAGRFDEVVLPKKKPQKRKRKKREGNLWDPKYVPPEIPSRAQLDGWLARVEAVINELMPCVIKYREGKAIDGPAQQALKLADSKLVTSYPSGALTDVEAQEWLSTLEEKLRAYYDAKAAAEASSRELRRTFTPAKDRAFELRSLVSQAEAWELYKAPELFHEKLEIVTLLFRHLKYELDLDNQQPSSLRDKSSRRSGSGDEGFSWQKDDGSRRRRKSWNSWDSAQPEPEPEPVEDAEIAGRTRQKLVDVLTSVAALAAAVDAAYASQKQYGEAGKHIPLTRPAKPNESEVDAVLTAAQAWAKTYQSAKVQAYKDGVKVVRCVENVTAALAQVGKAVSALKDAVIPEQDRIVKDAVLRAYDQLAAYVKSAPEYVKTVTKMTAPYALDGQDSQTDRDAAANLRNLMRKATFALAQSEAAKTNYESAKGEHVPQAESVPPVLTQSSASAYVNAFSRMTEITARNTQKTEAHSAKVKLLSGQHSEREQQAREAVRTLNSAINGLGGKKQEWSAALELMHSTATLFCGAFNK